MSYRRMSVARIICISMITRLQDRAKSADREEKKRNGESAGWDSYPRYDRDEDGERERLTVFRAASRDPCVCEREGNEGMKRRN